MPRTGKWHAVTWLVWAVAAAVTLQLAPSPVYVALVIAIAAVVVQAHALDTPLARAFPVLIAVGIVFAFVRIGLTAATTHGVGEVLFTTPAVTLPKIFGGFTVGGPIELEVVLQAGAEAFVVIGMMAVFGAFNAVVSHYELVQAAPRAFYEVGVIITIALAFVPSTIAAIEASREADRARTGGRVTRRGRLVRLAVPLLETGMERAVLLAESMDSRGFAHETPSKRDVLAGWCGLAALLGLAGAFVALIGRASAVAALLGVLGISGMIAAVALASANSARVRYRRRPLTRDDWMIMGLAVASPVMIGVISATTSISLVWAASPLHWPTFALLPAIALAPLLAPLKRFGVVHEQHVFTSDAKRVGVVS